MKRLSLLVLCLALFLCTGCQSSLIPTEPATVPSTQSPQPTETVPPTTAPPPRVVDFALEAPWGYVLRVSDEYHHFYASPDAPWDRSALTVDLTARDESILTMEEDAFWAREGILDEDAEDLEILNFEQTLLDGWPAILSEYEYSTEDGPVHAIRYEVVADEYNYVFLYTDRSQGQYWDYHFRQSIATLALIEQTESMERDYEGLAWTEIDDRLGMYVKDGLRPLNAPGFTACMGDQEVVVLTMADNKEEMHLTGLTLEEYAQLLCSTNDLEPFQVDAYGNLITEFTSTGESGKTYYNVLTVKQTDLDFWVVQMTCQADDQASYHREFALWASSIQGLQRSTNPNQTPN